MNTYKIGNKDLNGRALVFKEVAGFLKQDFQGQSFFFNGFMFSICTNGYVKIRINYSEYQITSGDMFIVLPQHIFSVLECSAAMEVRTVFISLDFIHHFLVTPDFDLLTRINIYPCVKLDSRQLDDMIKIHSVICRYDKEGSRFKQIQDALTLSLVLIAVSVFEKYPSVNSNTCTRPETLTRSFFDLLLQHFMKERTVAFYADKLCITPKYLTTAVKSVTNHSVQSWINEVVLTEAKRYIKTTDFSIQQISELLNFPSASSFIRFFKTHTGSTPLEYRKKGDK